MESMRPLIERLHGTRHVAALAVSGAGTQAVAWLLGVSGASRTVLEVVVPYGRLAMRDYLGFEPAQSAAAATARQMARCAYDRAGALREDGSPVVGLACAAAIATDRPRRGEHRAFVAAWDAASAAVWSLTFHKGLRDRAGEETAVSRLIVLALAEFSGLELAGPERIGGALGLGAGDAALVERAPHSGPLERLLAGEIRWVTRHPDGGMEAEGPVPPALLPGSFNPLHLGHREMLAAAGRSAAYELSITNVDKPPLPEGEILRRLAQFPAGAGGAPGDTIILTRAETFYKKAALFPGTVFVLGWDTAARLVAPRYYGGEGQMMLALAEMMAGGARFLVAGRMAPAESGGSSAFRTLADVPVPAGFAPMFAEIPEPQFRRDISSTELRQRPPSGFTTR